MLRTTLKEETFRMLERAVADGQLGRLHLAMHQLEKEIRTGNQQIYNSGEVLRMLKLIEKEPAGGTRHGSGE